MCIYNQVKVPLLSATNDPNLLRESSRVCIYYQVKVPLLSAIGTFFPRLFLHTFQLNVY